MYWRITTIAAFLHYSKYPHNFFKQDYFGSYIINSDGNQVGYYWLRNYDDGSIQYFYVIVLYDAMVLNDDSIKQFHTMALYNGSIRLLYSYMAL